MQRLYRVFSMGLLHTVSVVEPDDGLRECLLVEYGLYPEDALLVAEVLGQVEGGDDGDRLLAAFEPDPVLVRLDEHLAVLVGDQDPDPPLLVGGVLAALELGVDNEGGLAFLGGPYLIEHPEEGEPALELRATLGEDERRALDHAVTGLIHASPRPVRGESVRGGAGLVYDLVERELVCRPFGIG